MLSYFKAINSPMPDLPRLNAVAKELSKYSVAASISSAADYTVFYFFLLTSISRVLATVLSHVAGSIVAFILLSGWVFQYVEQHDRRTLILKFVGAQTTSLILNTTCFWLFIHYTSASTWVARISAAVIVGTLIYFVNKFYVFKG